MAPYSSNTYDRSSYNGSMPSSSHNANLALDNLIRRELKVSNPNDAKEVAGALLNRYQSTPQAIGITREAEGLPFLRTPSMMEPMSTPAETASSAELRQAVNDVDRDLTELTTNAILKDVTPELEGWAMAIRNMMTEGFNSARFALDSSQRDKTFGLRRTLGDYARMARFVGALSSPVVTVNYRNLAQSIDEVTAVLLVMMGESLANVSFNRSRYLLQVPYSELQGRRDSVIYALRNFLGSTQTAYAPNEWPRGVDAYRQLYKYLDDQGQGDLRSLLTENELSRILDMLIQRASHGNVEGLRNLGATAQLEIPRLRRLVLIGTNLSTVDPSSPPLTAFLQALQLFIDAFDSAGGFRLLRLARPPILSYGFYGSTINSDDSENCLVELAILRNQLAELLDCFLQCGCSPRRIINQILLDKILYDLDRAIDLYALGTAANTEPEYRAVAYAHIINAWISIVRGSATETIPDSEEVPVREQLRVNNETPDERYLMSRIITVLEAAYDKLRAPYAELVDNQRPEQDRVRERIIQELCIQREMERSWTDLVQTMASSCLPFRSTNGGLERLGIFEEIDRLVSTALRLAGSENQVRDCTVDFNLPPQYEFSLESIAETIDEGGEG